MASKRRFAYFAVLATAVIIASACGPAAAPTPTPQPTPTATRVTPPAAAPTATATAVPSPVATPTPTATAVPRPVATPTPTATPVPKSAGKIVLLWDSDTTGMLPWGVQGGSIDELMPQLFDFTFWMDTNLNPINRLVASWKWVDLKSVDFDLAKGPTDHDGNAFTADDISWIYENFRDAPDSTFRGRTEGFFGKDSRMEVLAKDKVRFHMTKTNVVYRNVMGINYAMTTRAAIEKQGREKFERNPIGTGPYRFVEWLPKQRVVVEAYEGYWRGPARIKRVEFHPVPDYATRISLVQTGQADMIRDVNPNDVKTLKANPNVKLVSAAAIPQTFMILNMGNPILSSKEVRQALNYAADKQIIVDTLYAGFGAPSRGGDTSAIPVKNPKVVPYPYDTAKAKTLIAKAGYANGFTMEIGGAPGNKELMEALQAQYADAGVKVNLKMVEASLLFPEILKGSFSDAVISGCNNSPQERFACSQLWFHPQGQGAPYMKGAPADWDAKIDAISAEFDTEKRMRLIWALEEEVYDVAPWVFLIERARIFALNTRIGDFASVVGGRREAYLISLK